MSLLRHIKAILTLGRGTLRGVSELEAGDDPIALFREWFDDARDAGFLLPESMAVATATPDGRPSVRMMLLKGVEEEAFLFYTNYGSRKAAELDENPRAALVFHWDVLERQVRVEGSVERLPKETSVAYFRTRSRGSQIGAWASRQSEALGSREALERRFRRCAEEFRGEEVPLPDFWGGYRLRPVRIEFWQGRANRLHDRLEYRRSDRGWSVTRLYP